MRDSLRRFGVFLTILPVWTCGGKTGTVPDSEATISAVAEAYLNEVLDLMQNHSVNRYSIDWPTFRELTFTVAGAAQTPAGTHNAIRSAVERPSWMAYLAPVSVGRWREFSSRP